MGSAEGCELREAPNVAYASATHCQHSSRRDCGRATVAAEAGGRRAQDRVLPGKGRPLEPDGPGRVRLCRRLRELLNGLSQRGDQGQQPAADLLAEDREEAGRLTVGDRL